MRLVAVILLIYREILPCALAHIYRYTYRCTADAVDDRVTRACVYLACNPLMREEEERKNGVQADVSIDFINVILQLYRKMTKVIKIVYLISIVKLLHDIVVRVIHVTLP